MQWSVKLIDQQGVHTPLLKRGTLVDTSRFNDDGSVRSVDFKLYHPSDIPQDEKLPLIIWSHGYGGSHDGAGFLGRYVASHGYFVLHITHKGTDSSLWEGQGGHPWDVLKDLEISRTTTLNRYKDISFVLDAFPKWLRDETDLYPYVDFDTIGMSGHSFGAITTQVAAGQLTPDEQGEMISLHEPRILSAIAYSPVPGTSHLSNDDLEKERNINIYETIKTPMLHMTGTHDESPMNGIPYDKRLKVYEQSHLAPKALLVKEEGDHMVYNGTRGALGASALRDRHEDMIKHISLAWWDAWLKESNGAHHWLTSDLVQDYLGDEAQWTHKLD